MPFTSFLESLKDLVQAGVDKAVKEIEIPEPEPAPAPVVVTATAAPGVTNENQLLEAIESGETEILITDSFALNPILAFLCSKSR